MDAYLDRHFKAVEFIHNTANHLEVNLSPKLLACLLYHKAVAVQKQLKEKPVDRYLLGATCVYLAAKIEEQPLKIRDVVNVCYRLHNLEKEALEIGKTYWNLRDSITTCELMLLRLFKFQTSFQTPIKFLLHYLDLIQNWADAQRTWNDAKVHQICVNLITDSTFLPLLCFYTPQLIAVSVMYTAFHTVVVDVPKDSQSKEWFEVFCPGATVERIQSVSYEILSIYDYDVVWMAKKMKKLHGSSETKRQQEGETASEPKEWKKFVEN